MSVDNNHSKRKLNEIDDAMTLAMTGEEVERRLQDNSRYLKEWQNLITEAGVFI